MDASLEHDSESKINGPNIDSNARKDISSTWFYKEYQKI